MTQQANTPATKPQNIDQAFEQQDATAEEEKALAAEAALAEPPAGPPNQTQVPEWVTLPEKFAIPAGKTVAFLRFRAAWTDTPEKGDRVCVVWPLTDTEQLHALKRAHGDQDRTIPELAKQMIRVMDGLKADWTGNPPVGSASVTRFWTEIGEKCRKQLQVYYLKTHTLSMEEQVDFFENCFVVKTAQVG